MKPDNAKDVFQVAVDLLNSVEDFPLRAGIEETPERFTKAWAFWTSGYDIEPASVLKQFGDGAENYDGMVFQGQIPIYSLCEHHLAPFFGVAHIGYMPDKRIVGLSKLSRLADIFARRLQVQERLTDQIADTLHDELHCKGVGVVLRCRHLCMESRGVQKSGTITMTSSLRGLMRESQAVRAEFFDMVKISDGGHPI